MGGHRSHHPNLLCLHCIRCSLLHEGETNNKLVTEIILNWFQLVGHKSEVYEHNIKELELLKDQLDESGDHMDDINSQKGSINIV